MIRLNKYLSSAGIGSRRKCDDYITEGRVTVNGEVVVKLGSKVDPQNDEIRFDGSPVKPQQDLIYILLNKPAGIVTTASDEFNRQTVLDLVSVQQRVYPVGRLDLESTGLLLLTNDGDLTNELIHPRYKISKTYHVLLDKVIRPVDAYHFERGLMLDGKKTSPCKLSVVRVVDNCSLMEVTIAEGRNRQIRRMFELLGYQVEELDRIAFGPLTIAGLKRGEWRYLKPAEVAALKMES